MNISIHVTMATKTSYHQRFHKKWHIQQKGHIQSKLSPSSTTEYEYFLNFWFDSLIILRNQHLIYNIKFKFTNELSQFMLPWQPNHHIISDFTKKGIFNKEGIFYVNYLLSAWQNMNYFQHILHNLYLLYKYTNNSFKDSRLELPWQQLQEICPKNMTNIEVCPRKNVKLKPFRLIWVFLWLHLLIATLVVFIILVSCVPFSQFIARCHGNQKEWIWPKTTKKCEKTFFAHSHIQ